jgi:rhamnose transport system permease protein
MTDKTMGARAKIFAKPEQLRELGLLLFILLIGLVVQLRNPGFLSITNITALFTNTAILGILAVGMMLVLVTRGIDLSIGAIIAFSGMTTALTVARFPGMPPMLAMAEGMLIGMVFGSISGFLVAWMDVLPIIATLGMMNVVRGLTYVVSGGQWVSSYQMSAGFKGLATGKILGINNLIVIAFAVFVLAAYFINHTRTGRRIYAVGSNPEAAGVSGLPRRRLVFYAYLIMGGLAGLAGVLWVAKFASAQGNTAIGYELNVIAACILGGVSIAGGVGRIFGLILGTVLFGILNNALPLIDVSPFWQMGIQGLVVLAAVITNVLVRRNTERNALRRRAI